MQHARTAINAGSALADDDPTVDLRVRTELAQVSNALNLLRVRNDAWPFEDFAAYVDALRERARIGTDAELARRSGIASSVISRWRSGQMQPSRENLAKLAEALGVKPVQLWVAAGLAHPDEMDLSGEIDLRVLPREIQDLADIYRDPRLSGAGRESLRHHLQLLIAGLRAQLDDDPPVVVKRPRRGVA